MSEIVCPAKSLAFRFAVLIGAETFSGRSLTEYIKECPTCANEARRALTNERLMPDRATLGENHKKMWEAISKGEHAPQPLRVEHAI